MVGGFALFVWNMTGFVNNMRMDSQGSATSIIQEMESLDDFMDRDGSAAVDVNEAPERMVSLGTHPKLRLSRLLSRLSPITKYSSSPTVTMKELSMNRVIR